MIIFVGTQFFVTEKSFIYEAECGLEVTENSCIDLATKVYYFVEENWNNLMCTLFYVI